MSKENGQSGFAHPIIITSVALLAIVGILGFVFMQNVTRTSSNNSSTKGANDTPTKSTDTSWPDPTAKYITSVPLDLTQIKSISKYRSCSGHDFSGYSFEKDLETDRSMKHYIYPIETYQGTIDKVKMFAPFDGTVSSIDRESDAISKPGKRPMTGNGIAFTTDADKNVDFQFGHIYFVKEFNVGDTVKSGDLIGYAALGDVGNDFDIVLEGAKKSEQSIYGSVFDHMTDKVLTEFAKYNITPTNTKLTKEFRDANPCNYNTASQTSDRNSDDWVQLEL